MVTIQEVARHASEQSCWISIRGVAYDVTDFLDRHPGGKSIIMKQAGADATTAFESVHSSDLLAKYSQSIQEIGAVVDYKPQTSDHASTDDTQSRVSMARRMVQIINIPDFEVAASEVMPPKYFAFFKAGADAEITARWNSRSWDAIRFRPRVLRPVHTIDISTTILGTSFSAPFFIAPAGGGKFAHPKGEVLLTRAAAQHGILQWVCNNAGCSQAEMAQARGPGQTLYWQIYAMKDLDTTRKEIQEAVALGYRGFALTVDAIQVGKRERDIRQSIAEMLAENPHGDLDDTATSNSVSNSRPACYDEFDFPTAVRWLRSITDLPIAVKGIQSWEDAAACMRHGVHPWLSNHGGRQLDGAPSAAETLVEIRQNCPDVLARCDVIVDGGVTRGTDVAKALALGARGVALGRGFLFSLVFGQEGVSKAVRILKSELQTAMGLLGVTSVEELGPSHVDASGLLYAGAVARSHL